MYLNKLVLFQFKNYAHAELSFDKGINCFTGDNGSGKTNLLDAIHYLSLCKSAFNATDSQNIMHGMNFFTISGDYLRENQEDKVICSFKKGDKKRVKLNQTEYARLAEHIGHFPLVMISPEDSMLVTGGSEERRRLIDSTVAQSDKEYLELIVTYNKVLQHRNSLLKHFAQMQRFDKNSLEAWNIQLADAGEKISIKRKEFLDEFIPYFQKYFLLLSDKKEEAGIEYHTQIGNRDFIELLNQSVEKDRIMQYTTVGIHKDELVFTLSGFAVKKFGSQGQQKSFLTALKLAQYEYLKVKKGIPPVLLLDDIFDKLDEHRITRLMNIVSGEGFGQVFLTDSHPERVTRLFEQVQITPKIFVVEHGTVTVKS